MDNIHFLSFDDFARSGGEKRQSKLSATVLKQVLEKFFYNSRLTGVSFETTSFCDVSPDPSARLNLDSERYLGQITLWKSGNVDFEVLDCEQEDTIFFGHVRLQEDSEEKLKDHLSRFVAYFLN
ncbi:hypothetical protein GKIL_0447 [Gloeobacter kilaueensis JS1]|uniref:Uncharacterized protein n=2 Tax=Gloeobacter TaxID=33071 RepID=U5QCW7_GLOK1|nr:hypothetical protein GKIL_0447 [Gloeobacter kilaueensis JS1]